MKKSLILITLLLSFVLVSCGNNVQIKDDKDIQKIENDAKNGAEENAQNTTKHSRVDCMKGCEMLWKGNALNKDKKIEDMNLNCNGLCDFQQGVENNDVSYCEKSTGTYKDMCYSAISKNTKDATLCEKIKEKIFLYSCYQTIAEETKDVKYCDKITDKLFKEGCLEKFKK